MMMMMPCFDRSASAGRVRAETIPNERLREQENEQERFNISQLVQNGKVVQDPKQIAQIFNNSFINVAAQIDSDIPRTRKSPLDYLGCKLEHSFFLSPTDSAEIESIISQLKNRKAVGPYSIPCNQLKMLNSSISPMLAILINESF